MKGAPFTIRDNEDNDIANGKTLYSSPNSNLFLSLLFFFKNQRAVFKRQALWRTEPDAT